MKVNKNMFMDNNKPTKNEKKTASSVKTITKSQTFNIQNTRTVTYSESFSTTHNSLSSGSRSTNLNDVASSFSSNPTLHSSLKSSFTSPTSVFQTNTKPTAKSIFEVDARPMTGSGQIATLPNIEYNYQSTFSRRLNPYSSSSSSVPPTNSTVVQPRGVQISLNNNANNNCPIPTYNTNGRHRGKVLIINNIKFFDNDERKGAEVDEKEISRLFKEMGFEVVTQRNLSTTEMKSKIKKFSSDKSLLKVDISVVVMMSHGNNQINHHTVPGSFTQVLGTDKKGLEINEIVEEFSADKCPGMVGKPKLFFFQCCRGNRNELQVDAVPFKPITKAHADVLIAYSTIPGFYSIRDPKKGSWYIQSICQIFRKHSKDYDVETMLKIVDEELSKKDPTYKQTSAYESRGFKRCYLNPR